MSYVSGEKLGSKQKGEIIGKCEKCKGKGYIYTPKKEGIGFEKSEVCECAVEYESLKESWRLFQKSGINRKILKRYLIDNWIEVDKLLFDNLLSIIDKEEKWLFIHGKAGTGKTFAAMICAYIALLREKKTYFVDVASLLEDLRPDNESRSLVYRKCLEADVLILDDIGHEKSSQWVRERLYIIINKRWTNMQTTIFTSNFSIENLRDTVSEAVYSRVKGDSIEVEMFSTEDKRLK